MLLTPGTIGSNPRRNKNHSSLKTNFSKEIISFLFGLLTVSSKASSQIIPDATLLNNSNVTQQGRTSIISGGTRAGSNLFHSFQQFSLPSGGTIHFNNDLNIQNIFSRVTGGSISNIDGMLRANGTANLFLINPNGIIFGPNASLNIGGSFLGSTAQSVNFADGTHFNTKTPESTPLLTVSVPIGLGFGSNPGTINVQGTGHILTSPSFDLFPILGAGGSSSGLRVMQGKTLALVGGNVNLNGGIVVAPGGRIELSGIGSGTVDLNLTSTGWTFSYGNVQTFQDIRLSQKALADASGFASGFIQLVGRQISLADGSVALIQNQGVQPGGSINVNAFDSVELSGTTPDGRIPSGFQIETLGGDAGDITVLAKRLFVQDGAAINDKTFTAANGGKIVLSTSDLLQVTGFSFINPTYNFASGVGTYTLSFGNSGAIIINTGEFIGLGGGTVTSATFGTGKGGDLIVNARRSVNLNGFNPFSSNPSQLSTSSFASGNAGNLKITAENLFVYNGSDIFSSAWATGNAGDVKISAFNSIDITQENRFNNNIFGISSFATNQPELIRKSLRITSPLSGDAGDVTINTRTLRLANGGIVNVSNLGSGKAGALQINANSVFLDNKSSIIAATKSGDGGNIALNVQDLQLRHNSRISATASAIATNEQVPYNSSINFSTGSGRGGNIIINANTLVALESTNITANAFQGRGGNIQINAQGLFQSPDSKFTASSNLGINGTVQVKTLVNNSTLGLVRLPIVPVDAAKLIAQGCGGPAGPRGNKFVVTGSGGFPSSPTDSQDIDRSESDWGTTNAPSGENHASAYHPSKSHNDDDDDFVEATGAIRNAKGQIELVANAPTYTPAPPWIKPAGCRAH